MVKLNAVYEKYKEWCDDFLFKYSDVRGFTDILESEGFEIVWIKGNDWIKNEIMIYYKEQQDER